MELAPLYSESEKREAVRRTAALSERARAGRLLGAHVQAFACLSHASRITAVVEGFLDCAFARLVRRIDGVCRKRIGHAPD